MSNPTSNFGWQMPTPTDLVTDLPADFEVFGQAVDTDFVDLLGGTTGQVLAKTSATDLDFTWVTPTDQTPLTTKGDLFTFTTTDARIGVGTNGQILSANSAQATGLEWVTPNPGDITGVAAGNGLSGGGTSGDVTVSINTAITADLTTAQTLTNKKLSDSTTTIVDVTDATKAIKFDVAGTTGITGTIATAFTTAKIVTIPDTTGTVALTNGVINNTLTTTTGDIIYASAANTPARLGIGSASQVLSVSGGIPAWTAAPSGLTKIATANFSASAAVQISNCFTSTYVNYIIVLNALGNSGGGALYMNWMTGTNTVFTTAVYYGGGWSVTNSAATATISNNGDTKFTLAPTVATNLRQNFTINCSNVGNGSEDGNMSSLGNGSGNGIATYAGIIASGASTTGVQFTGNGNLTGTYTVYGLAK